MFEKTKQYFEEHPEVKKALIITGKIAGVCLVGFTAYKIGKSIGSKNSNNNYIPEIPETSKTPATGPVLPDLHYVYAVPSVPKEHSFDMIFKDVETGEEYIAKDSCLGSYVEDMLDSFSDTDIEIVRPEIPID